MNVAILKYNSGNIQSVRNALDRLGVQSHLTDRPEELQGADRVIFPGVGEASSAMKYLKKTRLDETILSLKQPVLAICLGMQLLCNHSDENDTVCLGIVPYKVNRFPNKDMKVPQIGWNTISNLTSPLLAGVADKSRMYFVHSYYVERGEFTTAESEYGVTFSAALSYKNFYGVQFHPEKSGPIGAKVIENFLKL